MTRRPQISTLFPYPTLSLSHPRRALWQSDPRRYQIQPGQRSQVAKQHQWLVKLVLLGIIATPARAMAGIGPQNMIVDNEMLIAQALHRLDILADRRGVSTDLRLGKCDANLHRNSPL